MKEKVVIGILALVLLLAIIFGIIFFGIFNVGRAILAS